MKTLATAAGGVWRLASRVWHPAVRDITSASLETSCVGGFEQGLPAFRFFVVLK